MEAEGRGCLPLGLGLSLSFLLISLLVNSFTITRVATTNRPPVGARFAHSTFRYWSQVQDWVFREGIGAGTNVVDMEFLYGGREKWL